jgi:AbrB family looped-hinge helix DNA binding protein
MEVRNMPLVKLSSKGQLVIPKAIREKLGLKPNKPLILEMVDEHAEIKPLPDVKRALKGMFKGRPSMCQALVKEHRMEVKKDEKLSS